jgi:uncharacterized protein
MKINGDHTFLAPRATVWELLQDPDVLIKALPGAKKLERVGENVYEGLMRVGVGPVTAAEWSVRVELEDLVPPERYSMRVDSKGPLGFTRGTAHVELMHDPAGTRMEYVADLQVGGRVAGVGQRLLDQVARMLTKHGLEALNRELEARLARGPAPMGESEEAG